MTDQSTQPLTDERMESLYNYASGLAAGWHGPEMALAGESMIDLWVEADRTRAENTALAERIYLVGTLTVPEGEWTRMFEAGYTAALKTVRFALGLDQDGRGQANG